MGEALLEVRNLSVLYSDVIQVLRGISLRVTEGAIVALLGANGAGKTTVLKAICGLLEIQDGRIKEGVIEFAGQPINGQSIEKIVSLGICMVREGRHVFSYLTVYENLKVGAYLQKGGFSESLERVWHYFPRLRELRSVKAGYLSGGEQQMLAIGRALMARPKLLILDEPSLGLAPKYQEEIFGIIRSLNEESNYSILLVEQNANLALQTAAYGYILETGKIVLDGPTGKLMQNEDVREFYLGIGMGSESSRIKYTEVKSYKRRKRWHA